MAKTIKLASVLLKCSLGSGKTDEDHKISAKKVLNILMLVALIPIVVALFQVGLEGQRLFALLEGEEIMLNAILFLASLFIFVVGVFSCINTFYLSSNLECLLVMPFSSIQITGAKFIVAALYEYYISFAVVAPVLIGFGYGEKAPVMYWIGAALTVLLLPILPLAYSAIIAMLIMRLLGGAKNKQRMATLGAFGVVLGSAVFSVVSTYFQHMHSVAMQNMLDEIIKFSQNIMWIFPNVPLLTKVMHGHDLLSIAFALLVIIVSVVVFLFLANVLYLAGAIGMQDTSSKHIALNDTALDKASRQKGIVNSYMWKELKSVFRTPSYYISCFILTLSWPIIIVVPTFINAGISKSSEMLDAIATTTSDPVAMFARLFWLIVLANAFCTLTNQMAPSAISREGTSFPFMKQLPIPYKKQIKAKRNAALVICEIGGCLYMTIIVLYLAIAHGYPMWSVPVTAVISAILIFIIVDFQMILGLMSPRLEWESEVEAIKGGKFFIMFILFSFLSFIGLIAEWNPLDFLHLTLWPLVGATVVIFLVIAFALDRLLYFYGVRKLNNL